MLHSYMYKHLHVVPLSHTGTQLQMGVLVIAKCV